MHWSVRAPSKFPNCLFRDRTISIKKIMGVWYFTSLQEPLNAHGPTGPLVKNLWTGVHKNPIVSDKKKCNFEICCRCCNIKYIFSVLSTFRFPLFSLLSKMAHLGAINSVSDSFFLSFFLSFLFFSFFFPSFFLPFFESRHWKKLADLVTWFLAISQCVL